MGPARSHVSVKSSLASGKRSTVSLKSVRSQVEMAVREQIEIEMSNRAWRQRKGLSNGCKSPQAACRAEMQGALYADGLAEQWPDYSQTYTAIVAMHPLAFAASGTLLSVRLYRKCYHSCLCSG